MFIRLKRSVSVIVLLRQFSWSFNWEWFFCVFILLIFLFYHLDWSLWYLFFWECAAAGTAKSLQSCPTLCDLRDGSPPGSPIPGILQARTLEWVAISFSNAWKWKVKVKSLSRVWLFTTPWTTAHQPPLSVGLSRQEYWSGVPLPSLKKLLGPPKKTSISYLFAHIAFLGVEERGNWYRDSTSLSGLPW